MQDPMKRMEHFAKVAAAGPSAGAAGAGSSRRPPRVGEGAGTQTTRPGHQALGLGHAEVGGGGGANSFEVLPSSGGGGGGGGGGSQTDRTPGTNRRLDYPTPRGGTDQTGRGGGGGGGVSPAGSDVSLIGAGNSEEVMEFSSAVPNRKLLRQSGMEPRGSGGGGGGGGGTSGHLMVNNFFGPSPPGSGGSGRGGHSGGGSGRVGNGGGGSGRGGSGGGGSSRGSSGRGSSGAGSSSSRNRP